MLTHQITHVNIDIQTETTSKPFKIASNILDLILSLTTRLTHLNFCQVYSHRETWIPIFDQPRTTRLSLNLTELIINVECYSDCLYLLDGCLNSLSKLIISVREFSVRRERKYANGWVNIISMIIFSIEIYC